MNSSGVISSSSDMLRHFALNVAFSYTLDNKDYSLSELALLTDQKKL